MSGPLLTPRTRGTCAFQALAGYAAARVLTGLGPPRPGTTPSDAGERIASLLTGLRHSADSDTGGFRFGHALEAGRAQYRHASARRLPARLPVSAAADLALDLHDRALAAGKAPQDRNLTTLHLAAQVTGRPFGEVLEAFTAALVADLEQYCHENRISFSQAVSASHAAYTAGLIARGALADPGTDTRATALLPPPAGPEQIPPVFTSQGIIVSASDAEWFLVRCAARNRDSMVRPAGTRDSIRDDSRDQNQLAEALAAVHQTTAASILARLEPAIAARTAELGNGPDAARHLGSLHGIAGTPPWARHGEGEEALMAALGETEATSNANEPHRRDLIHAYVNAYQRAQKHPAARPARAASRGFPQGPREFLPRTDPAALIRQSARQPARGPRRPLHGL
jgi:hypothetical protein